MLRLPETFVDRFDRESGGVGMSFWVWVGVALVVVLVVALVSDRRRRGGWFLGYSGVDREMRRDRLRDEDDRGAGHGGSGGVTG